MPNSNIQIDFSTLSRQIKSRAKEMGFTLAGITDIDLSDYSTQYQQWIENNFHGELDYMQRHGNKRWHPEKLIPGTIRIISLAIDYWPQSQTMDDAIELLDHPSDAYVSRYALGRDYHKVLRKRQQDLCHWINEQIIQWQNNQASLPDHELPFAYRVFTDSAPVLEKPLAEKSGLGWIGKHSNLINPKQGSWFFLGEIYTNLPLDVDSEFKQNHCGSCTRCIDVCPTKAIVAPYIVDARRCISYLTIELKGGIPIEFRQAIGNRIYGCDDCQLFCPWNKFASTSEVTDFKARHSLDQINLLDCFLWDEETFLEKTLGSPIRRIGHERWLRNVAVALGNADYHPDIEQALTAALSHPSDMVVEHVQWALDCQLNKSSKNKLS